MNDYFPLIGLAMFAAVAWALVKYTDYQGRLWDREQEELRRKEAEAHAATAAPEPRSQSSE
jgi:hypothetical protein